MARVPQRMASWLLVVPLSAALGDGCKKLRGGSDADAAPSASAATAVSAPVDPNARSFVPLLRDCAARAVVFDVGGRTGVILSRAADALAPDSLALTYATWDPQTGAWSDEVIPSVTAKQWVYEVTATGTWDAPRLRLVHGDAAVKEIGGRRTYWSTSSDGSLPALSIAKTGASWSTQAIDYRPGRAPSDDGAIARLPVAPPPRSTSRVRKASAMEREQAKVLTKAPGCVYFTESAMTAPPGWSYGHLGGAKCKTSLSVALHDLGADRAESFTWPAKKDAPLTIAIRVLGADTYAVLLRPGASATSPFADKLFKLAAGKATPMPLPADNVQADLWKRGDELRANGAAHLWRLRGKAWESFGPPGNCRPTDEGAHVSTYVCTADSGSHTVVAIDGAFVDLPPTVGACAAVPGHESSLLSCGTQIVELVNGKPAEPQKLPRGDGGDEGVVFAGGGVWAARGNAGRSSVFRLGPAGKSFSCTESGPLKIVPYVSRDGEAPITFGDPATP